MLQKDLREFIALLNAHQVESLIVGAHAMAFYGCPRTTGDIDFLVRPTMNNAQRVLKVLRDFGFARLDISLQDLCCPDMVIQLGLPPNRIDLLTSITAVNFEEAWAARVTAELDGLPVAFISKNDLIANKQALGRAKDLADLALLTGA